MIKMKYPYDSNNSDYDGKEHDIEPKCLVNYKGNIYLLYYRDMTLEKNTHTFLIKNDLDEFFMVPLDSYNTKDVKSVVKELLRRMTVEENAASDALNLPDKIGCISCQTFDDIVNDKVKIDNDEVNESKEESSKDFSKSKLDTITPIFHNLADDKYYCDSNCTRLVDDDSTIEVSDKYDKDSIISENGHVYDVVDIYVNKDKPMIVTPIFRNSDNGKYYCDPDCTMLIDDISVFGTLNEENGIIINPDIIYKILDVGVNNQDK